MWAPLDNEHLLTPGDQKSAQASFAGNETPDNGRLLILGGGRLFLVPWAITTSVMWATYIVSLMRRKRKQRCCMYHVMVNNRAARIKKERTNPAYLTEKNIRQHILEKISFILYKMLLF